MDPFLSLIPRPPKPKINDIAMYKSFSPLSWRWLTKKAPGTPNIRKVYNNIQIKVPDVQGDTGANCSATNNQQYLWNYKTIEPIGISTYEGSADATNSLCAVGVGIMKIVAENNAVLHNSIPDVHQ